MHAPARQRDRIVIAALALVAVLAAVPAAHAATAGKQASFVASFEAKRTVSWKVPYRERPVSCFDTLYYSASGSETWTQRTPRPFRVLAYKRGRGPTNVEIGSWRPGGAADPTAAVNAGWRRSAVENHGTKPGPCPGNPPQVYEPNTSDCGVRRLSMRLVIGMNPGKLHGATWSRGPFGGFRDCLFQTPDPLLVPGRGIDLPDIRVPDSLLFGSDGLIVLIGSKPVRSQRPHEFGGTVTSTARTTWTLRLRRVR